LAGERLIDPPAPVAADVPGSTSSSSSLTSRSPASGRPLCGSSPFQVHADRREHRCLQDRPAPSFPFGFRSFFHAFVVLVTSNVIESFFYVASTALDPWRIGVGIDASVGSLCEDDVSKVPVAKSMFGPFRVI
jgi:hypothetical protein